ncbi:hypothetical protein [Chryseobacterium oryctis]|uniref:Uncharacterized protein n=1 Tax=Chryseobacterium oryctis TaxID=2952618 RepID=A0ABT3HPB7_9FLAO|nr:hypothetical protein [Chryseobacterium oryctis]MCW3161628.1 hypothetical protein [Chryseobacterium oryctis]
MISILLLFFYLVSTTELYQFLKIPILVEHFMEHKDLNPGMTVGAFLKLHYDDPVQDSDYQTDQKLPFVSHSCPLLVAFTVEPSLYLHFTEKIFKEILSKETIYKSFYYNKEILNSIWQPPKFC